MISQSNLSSLYVYDDLSMPYICYGHVGRESEGLNRAGPKYVILNLEAQSVQWCQACSQFYS